MTTIAIIVPPMEAEVTHIPPENLMLIRFPEGTDSDTAQYGANQMIERLRCLGIERMAVLACIGDIEVQALPEDVMASFGWVRMGTRY